MHEKSWESLRKKVIGCTRCPRLVYYRENVPAKKVFKDEKFWRKPVPGYGDHHAWLLIVGLAPAPDGGNRTGRIFTGDATGRFLVKALYVTGFANQPLCESKNDGLFFKGCYLTAAVKCVPPQHKPTRQECLNCNPYLIQESQLLFQLTSVLILGKFAFDAYLITLKNEGLNTKKLKFKHGASYLLENGLKLYCSYHPSPRNVNTGTLTEKMFLDLLKQIKKEKKGSIHEKDSHRIST